MGVATSQGWQGLYENGAFAITTMAPSILVLKNAGLIPSGSPVADLGCGNLRNSAFLGSRGHLVHACDLADLTVQGQLPPGVEFGHHGVDDFGFQRGLYGGILMIRLIHYLSPEMLESLMMRAAEGLRPDGVLMLSYNVAGGIHDMPELKVPKFQYPIRTITEMVASTGLAIIYLNDFITEQKHTNLPGSLHACELVAVRQ